MSNPSKVKFNGPKKSFKGKCAYMLMMIRQKDPMLWMACKKQFSLLSEEQFKPFYFGLIEIYKGRMSLDEVLVEIEKNGGSTFKRLA